MKLHPLTNFKITLCQRPWLSSFLGLGSPVGAAHQCHIRFPDSDTEMVILYYAHLVRAKTIRVER